MLYSEWERDDPEDDICQEDRRNGGAKEGTGQDKAGAGDSDSEHNNAS